MVTMKDVAKLAGVSHGTVSNVVNGVKNVSVDKIKKVEAAMAQLGYKPNSAARNLKMEFTNQIDLVIPNIISGEFIQLYEAVRKCAKNRNYTLNLKVTDGIPAEERRILNESMMNNVDGVILATCQPSNREFFDDMMKKGMRIMFCVADLAGSNCNFVGFDVSGTIEEIIEYYRSKGMRIAMITGDAESSYHDNLINTYCKSMIQETQSSGERYMEIIQVSPEFAAKGAAKLLALNPAPDVVIASNEAIAREIHKMQYLLDGKEVRNLKVVVLNQGKTTSFFEDEVIPLPYKTVGRTAFEALYDMIQGNAGYGNYRTMIPPLKWTDREENAVVEKTGKKLRILLNESPSSEAVKALIPNFTRKTGIEVEVVTRKISQMYDAVMADRREEVFDIYSIDLPWMEEIAGKGMISCLDDFAREHRDLMAQYTEDVLQAFSLVNGKTYAVPYVFSVQLLFYRKDLFEKIKNQRLYYEWYKEDLRVPQTWEEFNMVARLFTRQYNPDAETRYGITLGGSAFSGAACEYFPRLWSMGGDLVGENSILKDTQTAQAALENYIEGFRYANPEAVDWWWDEQVKEFMKGNAAMMIMFTEHASSLVEKKHFRIAGKYEVAPLPGKTSVLGGWSLVIRKTSEHQDEARQFLEWISDKNMVEDNAVLGRVYPRLDEQTRESLGTIYTWFDAAVEAFKDVKARCVPEALKKRSDSEVLVEKIIGSSVHEAVIGKIDAVQAIAQIKKDLQR